MQVLGEESRPYQETHYLRAFLRLIGVLSVAGNAFWLVRVSRRTELAYQSFVAVLWIGLLAFCPMPRMARMAQGVEYVDRVTTSGYWVLGNSFRSVLRNYMTPFLFACAGTATCLTRALVVLLGKGDGGKRAT
jgi:hypothetical protein